MGKLEPISAWLLLEVSNGCNIRCQYCYAPHLRNEVNIPKIDHSTICRTLDATGRTFLVTLLGGEPLMVPNIVEACQELTKRHYISFATNLTSPKIIEIAQKIQPGRIEYILAALHIRELERLGLVDMYVSNYIACKEVGMNIGSEVVAHPSLLEKAGYYKDFFFGKGVKFSFVPFGGEYEGKLYPSSYTPEEVRIFDIKSSREKHFNCKGQSCNAGYNVCVGQFNGDVYPCWGNPHKIGNVYERIDLGDDLTVCPLDYCSCSFKTNNKDLYELAVRETRSRHTNR
jgi:MoaA/NifB/PqqE/SkfB family radical SAM enzyme